ncbi:histone acetylation protein-domain-containing protein, partial [Tribonema minus]
MGSATAAAASAAAAAAAAEEEEASRRAAAPAVRGGGVSSSTLTSTTALQPYCAKSLPSSVLDRHLEGQANRLLPSGSPKVVVRMLANTRKAFFVPAQVRATFAVDAAGSSPPPTIAYTAKTVGVFQELDGVWVLCFVLMVHEYGADAPLANRGRVYISYLDSVPFMRPCHARTALFQGVLHAYLNCSRRRGFTKAHLWVCAPGEGSQSLFLQRPPHQKTPDQKGLEAWYGNMASGAVAAGIATDFTDFVSDFFSDATALR